MLDYQALRALAAVLRTGSFEGAAASLHVTPSAISQRIRGLEERLGEAVAVRAQPVRGTDIGLRLARHYEEVQLLESALGEELAPSAPERPTLRIAANADSLITWFVEAMAGAGEVLFDIVIDDQDHSIEWLRRGEVSAAVTAHAAPAQGCDAIPIGSIRYRATASPDFMRRWFPNGVTADALTTAPALVYDRKDRLQARWAARATGSEPVLRAHWLPSTQAFVLAARAGLGWGLNPEALVAEDLASGRLVELVPDLPIETPLYWQSARRLGVAMAPVTRAVRAAASTSLIPPDPR
ncbi:MAG: LysR family transcriptional regulator ArgP [Rubricella sp.]